MNKTELNKRINKLVNILEAAEKELDKFPYDEASGLLSEDQLSNVSVMSHVLGQYVREIKSLKIND